MRTEPNYTSMVVFLLLLLAIFALGGCATGKIPTNQPVKVLGTDFCRIQRTKITWDVKDTRPTIEQLRRFNRKHDAVCGTGATS